MNENLNLVEILKDCPKGTKLYSPLFGEVEFDCIYKTISERYVIDCKIEGGLKCFNIDGTITIGNVKSPTIMLYPNKYQQDWSKFKPKKTKFDPKTLDPFDKVLARNDREDWSCVFFSHIAKDEETYPYACGYDWFTYCIPYNDDTKCLVGTTEEAPEYYRYWED